MFGRQNDVDDAHLEIGVAQAPAPTAPNQIWVADITYIDAGPEGWLYLAAIMDPYSRKIIGWAMSERIDMALILKALSMALLHRQPPAHLLFHSDRGAQYASAAYRRALTQSGVTASMSRRGNCYDNAAMESFWSTLKRNWSIAAGLRAAPRSATKSSTTTKCSIIASASTRRWSTFHPLTSTPKTTTPMPRSHSPFFRSKAQNKHPNPREAAKIFRKNHRTREVLVMLGEPRLMFVSPVTKTKLPAAGLSFCQAPV